jgi:23S rRNA (pseudouridine1915-N3)-methyltransferase
MRMMLAGVGALNKKDPVDAATQDYVERLGHYARFELKLVDPSARKSVPDVQVRAEEMAALRKVALPGARWCALHEKGTLHSTMDLSKRLQGWMNSGKDVVFFQGGASGLHPELLAQCQEQWSLSPLTLPHRLARTVATEALYRAFTVLRGEPYHRA